MQIGATALFTHVKESAGSKAHEPEVYPRMHNEVCIIRQTFCAAAHMYFARQLCPCMVAC